MAFIQNLREWLMNKATGGPSVYVHHRSLATIAQEINELWSKQHYGAIMPIIAMENMVTTRDHYRSISGKDAIQLFLANASSWRGDDAKRIKAELKHMLKD
jgi:hypothetical protein